METKSDARRRVRKTWPRAYCLKDGKMYYIYGNPPRDYFTGAKVKNWRKLRGTDMLSYGESEREAWNSV